jgi:hypothetical protein
MITEIPSAAEFHEAGLNQIYLAWQIAMQTAQGFEQAQEHADYLDDEEIAAAAAGYWAKSQPILANAFSLVQQAMEMSLKGRIAAISPYLLIARDPKDWPSGVDAKPIPFSEFRSLDAADLIKVHNTFSESPLGEDFRTFWDTVRRDRNKMMHSVSAKVFDQSLLIRTILTAVETLFSETKWPQRLLQMEEDDKYAAYQWGVDAGHNIVMGQIQTAIENLKPAEAKRFFKLDRKRRSFLCPICWSNANRDWQDDWPKLAQFTLGQPGETRLHCVVCDEDSEVQRVDCINPECIGNVIHDDTCLLCLWGQDSPHNFPSGLQNEGLSLSHEYRLDFQSGHRSTTDTARFIDEKTAIEHARRAMDAVYLQTWDSVTITKQSFRDFITDSELIGSWIRENGNLTWHLNSRPGGS